MRIEKDDELKPAGNGKESRTKRHQRARYKARQNNKLSKKLTKEEAKAQRTTKHIAKWHVLRARSRSVDVAAFEF